MKEWIVRIQYEYEGSSGFDHQSFAEYVVKASKEFDALKKALSLLKKEARPQSILSYKCIELKDN